MTITRRAGLALAATLLVMVGMALAPMAAEAKEVTATGTWHGATYTVYDDGSAEVTGKFSSGYPSSAPSVPFSCTSIDASGVDVSSLKGFDYMFNNCLQMRFLDISTWDTTKAGEAYKMLPEPKRNYSTRTWTFPELTSVVFGPNTLPCCDGYTDSAYRIALPYGGIQPKGYTGKWIRADGAYGPYTPDEFKHNYTSEMAGLWVAERTPVTYTVTLDANGGSGSMSSLEFHTDGTADAIPGNAFTRLGYSFVSWNTASNGSGTSYIPNQFITSPIAGASAGSTVTLYAQWKQMSTSVTGSEFDITLHANEQVAIEGLPAGATYVVTETPIPSGWSLRQALGTVGIIEPASSTS